MHYQSARQMRIPLFPTQSPLAQCGSKNRPHLARVRLVRQAQSRLRCRPFPTQRVAASQEIVARQKTRTDELLCIGPASLDPLQACGCCVDQARPSHLDQVVVDPGFGRARLPSGHDKKVGRCICPRTARHDGVQSGGLVQVVQSTLIFAAPASTARISVSFAKCEYRWVL